MNGKWQDYFSFSHMAILLKCKWVMPKMSAVQLSCEEEKAKDPIEDTNLLPKELAEHVQFPSVSYTQLKISPKIKYKIDRCVRCQYCQCCIIFENLDCVNLSLNYSLASSI